MNLFDILGPVMVGPSSSHTAGAVRIGYISEKLLQDHVRKAEILLHGSFATTGIGHGTDKALIAGLLGMHPDDIRIPASFDLAQKAGMEFTFSTVTLKDAHPNTAVLRLSGEHGRKIEVSGSIHRRRSNLDRKIRRHRSEFHCGKAHTDRTQRGSARTCGTGDDHAGRKTGEHCHTATLPG